MSIEVRNLVKHYGQLAVCNHLNLTIPSGELARARPRCCA
jgi:sulfate transport system ATP-binding protein